MQASPSASMKVVMLEGSAVRCDGRSASLTAPNGQAQRQVLGAAFAVSRIAPGSLTIMEAHGTGTALGDPMEVGSVAATVLKHRDVSCVPLGVGSTKANAGHAEPGAGFSGLLRLATGLVRDDAAPNAQLRPLNPHISSTIGGMSCALPVQRRGSARKAEDGRGAEAGRARTAALRRRPFASADCRTPPAR